MRLIILMLFLLPAIAHADDDSSWMTGTNTQPPALLASGPVTFSLYIDTYYGYQFRQPIDHTVFPTTTAPRHDEVSINLAHVGVDVTGLDGPIGRLYIQYGSMVDAVAGQDPTPSRGFYLALQNVEQAAAGWHVHALNGINVELGIFPSYIGLDSYLPEENWSYNHAFMAEFTPYYLTGIRSQLLLTDRTKLELWLVNGWQTFGQAHDGRGGGALWTWRPREWLALASSVYVGGQRVYSDSSMQLRYYRNDDLIPRMVAVAVAADAGYEHPDGAPSGAMGGMQISHRIEWTAAWKTTLRFDIYDDRTQAISTKFPVGSPYPWRGTGALVVGGGSLTLDYWPSPWVVTRLEYSHREANQPYFAGHGGITGPDGVLPADPATFTPDLVKRDDRLTFDLTLRL